MNENVFWVFKMIDGSVIKGQVTDDMVIKDSDKSLPLVNVTLINEGISIDNVSLIKTNVSYYYLEK